MNWLQITDLLDAYMASLGYDSFRDQKEEKDYLLFYIPENLTGTAAVIERDFSLALHIATVPLGFSRENRNGFVKHSTRVIHLGIDSFSFSQQCKIVSSFASIADKAQSFDSEEIDFVREKFAKLYDEIRKSD